MPIRQSRACQTLELVLDTYHTLDCCKLIFVQCLFFVTAAAKNAASQRSTNVESIVV